MYFLLPLLKLIRPENAHSHLWPVARKLSTLISQMEERLLLMGEKRGRGRGRPQHAPLICSRVCVFIKAKEQKTFWLGANKVQRGCFCCCHGRVYKTTLRPLSPSPRFKLYNTLDCVCFSSLLPPEWPIALRKVSKRIKQ